MSDPIRLKPFFNPTGRIKMRNWTIIYQDVILNPTSETAATQAFKMLLFIQEVGSN